MGIFTVEITNGYVGCEQYYIASEHDYLEDICYSDHIVDNFRSIVGAYPSSKDIDDSYMSEEDIDDIVRSDIEFSKKIASISDLDNLSILPESILFEGCDEIEEYRKIKMREENVDNILNSD